MTVKSTSTTSDLFDQLTSNCASVGHRRLKKMSAEQIPYTLRFSGFRVLFQFHLQSCSDLGRKLRSGMPSIVVIVAAALVACALTAVAAPDAAYEDKTQFAAIDTPSLPEVIGMSGGIALATASWCMTFASLQPHHSSASRVCFDSFRFHRYCVFFPRSVSLTGSALTLSVENHGIQIRASPSCARSHRIQLH